MITSFRGKYFFLSNFYMCNITINNITYTNAESAFQSFKTKDIKIRKQFSNLLPRIAKKKGKKIELRKDWEDIKLDIMEYVVYQKFKQNKNLRKLLIETKSEEIIESNTWGDTFWGTNLNYEGYNHLGKILMKVRSKLYMKKVKCSIKKYYDIEKDSNNVIKTIRKIFKVLNKEINPYMKMKLKIKKNINGENLGETCNNVIYLYPNDIIKRMNAGLPELLTYSIIVIIHELFHSIQIVNDDYYYKNKKYKEIIENQVDYQTFSFILNNRAIFKKINDNLYMYEDYIIESILDKFKEYSHIEKIENNVKKFYINKLFSGIIDKETRLNAIKMFNEKDNIAIEYNNNLYIIKSCGVYDSCWWRIQQINLDNKNFDVYERNKEMMIVISGKQVKIKKGDK